MSARLIWPPNAVMASPSQVVTMTGSSWTPSRWSLMRTRKARPVGGVDQAVQQLGVGDDQLDRRPLFPPQAVRSRTGDPGLRAGGDVPGAAQGGEAGHQVLGLLVGAVAGGVSGPKVLAQTPGNK